MGKKVLTAKSGRAACPNAAAGGGIGAKNAKGAKSFLTGLTGFTGLREASVKPAKTKPSGVAWIGDIPEGWEVCFLSQKVSQVRNRNYGLKEKNLLSLSYGKIKRKSIESIGGLLPASFEGYNVIAADDIVLRLTDLQNDQHSLRVGLSHEQGIVTSAYTTIRPNAETNAMYLYYLLFAFDIVKGFYGMGSGVRQGLNYDEVKRIAIVVPHLSEQRAIADYLDEKCGAIDVAIAEAKKGIEEYKAWKKSLIFEVVTGKRRIGFFNAEKQSSREAESFSTGLTRFTGLGENLDNPVNPVKTKPSGIPWIGDVPEGWCVCRVKNISIIQHGQDPKTDGDIPVYGSGEGCFKTCGEYKNGPTVLIGRKGATLHIPHYIEGKYWNVDTAFDVKMKNSDVLRWFYYLAICFDYKAYMSQTTLPSMTQSDYRNMVIPLPVVEEQQAIADYLDEKCAAIDAMIAEKEALIADLEAYKKSLIYEVVTGKREVASTIEVK